MDFFLGDDQEEVAENLPGVGQGGGGGGGQGGEGDGGQGVEGGGGLGGGGGQGGGGGGQGGGGGGQGGEGGGDQGGGGGGGQGGEGGGGQGGGDGVDHADLVDRVMQILDLLQHATHKIVAAQEWVSNGRQLIGNLPGLAVKFRRALMGIYESQFQIQLCLGQIQLAINAIEPMFQAPVIEPFPDVIASVAEAHDVINAALVGLHSYLLVLVKAQVHAEAQARIQLGSGLFHMALGHCQEAFTIFEFLHDGHDWIWGEANVQEQA